MFFASRDALNSSSEFSMCIRACTPEDRRRTTHWACGIDRPCSQNGLDLCIQVLPRRKLPVALFVVGFICRGRRWLCRLRCAFAHLSDSRVIRVFATFAGARRKWQCTY